MSTTPYNSPLSLFWLRKPPAWMIYILLVATVATLIPLAFIARARFNTMEEPRIHLVQDMGNQPKYGAQKASTVFADGRAARPFIEGTVTREAVLGDDHYTYGYTRDPAGAVTFLAGYPARIKIDLKTVQRGQRQFNIYCSSCHGVNGLGNGMVNVRANEIQQAGGDLSYGTSWVQPANLHDETRRGRPEGHLYNTITNGIRSMGGLGHQITPDDRWAIVSYIRALQLSDTAPSTLLTPEVRENLK